MRIARALALAGIDSRRKCEEHVRNGAVAVNGEVVKDLGRQVDPEKDTISFRGRPLHFGKFVYYILHKPKGYTTTAEDPHAKKTVYELLPRELVRGSRQAGEKRTRVFPVGRLDRDTTGLLLFTNDGELANRLTHPRYGVAKCYDVRLNRPLEPANRQKILQGVKLEEGLAKVEKIKPLSRRIIRLWIREGKKREIRRVFEKLGYRVLALARIAFGPLQLGNFPPGRGRFLTSSEITRLRGGVTGGAAL
jgi:23S rRNA pseudouridine2605 synthase